MVVFPLWAVAPMLIIAGAGVLALLHALASSVRNDLSVHTLQVETATLRADYQARLQQIAEDTGVDIDVIVG